MIGIVEALMRGLAALLAALAIAAPAVAEVGCSYDAATHVAMSEAEHGPAADHAPDAPQQEPEEGSHCAFSHGHGTIAPIAGPDLAVLPSRSAFEGAPSAPAASARYRAPDRPPRG